MTIIQNPVTGPLVGAPIQPGFGVQSGGAVPVAATQLIAIPAGMTQLEAASRGILPLNANVSAVNGLSVGASDPASVLELLSNGNGVPTLRGAPQAPSGGINDQQFVSGTAAPTFQQNGPTPTNTEPQPLGPVSGAVLGANIALTTPSSFLG